MNNKFSLKSKNRDILKVQVKSSVLIYIICIAYHLSKFLQQKTHQVLQLDGAGDSSSSEDEDFDDDDDDNENDDDAKEDDNDEQGEEEVINESITATLKVYH